MIRKLNLASLSVACLSMCMAIEAQQLELADSLFYNANIITLDEHKPFAKAIAIKGGVILGLGTHAGLKSLVGEDTELIDLQGATVLPGFIDTHIHVFEGASSVGGDCEMSPSLPLEAQDDFLDACVEGISASTSWVMGYGFQLDTLLSASTELTPREYLDSFFPTIPVVIMEESSHAMIVNSAALSAAGITTKSDHPIGGRIMFDDEGEPNGVLFDNAGDRVMELAWNAQAAVRQGNLEGLLDGLALTAENGITTLGDGRMYWRRGWFDTWLQVEESGDLTARVSVRPWIYPDQPMHSQLAFLKDIQSDDPARDLIVNQVKMYVDGVLHFGTAKVAKPYTWSWQENDPSGFYYLTPADLNRWLPALNDIGYGAHIHAIGDQGSVILLTVSP